jgi:valyl-tRNA synthetase
MKGNAALYLPGADHAGFETQVVYEKKLAAEGKSRFDLTREELYTQVYDFVQQNKHNFENQFRRLGFSTTEEIKLIRWSYGLPVSTIRSW